VRAGGREGDGASDRSAVEEAATIAAEPKREPSRASLAPISDRSYKTIVSFKYALKGEAMHQEIRERWQAASPLSLSLSLFLSVCPPYNLRPPVPSALSIRAEDTRLESMGTMENQA